MVATAAVILWYSAGLMTFTIVTGVPLLAGRTEAVRAYQADGAEVIDATRFIVESKGLAFIALVAGATVIFSREARTRHRLLAALLVAPAFVVTFLGYARATLLALVVCTVLLACILRRPVLDRRRVAVAAVAILALVPLISLTGSGSAISDPQGNPVARQVAGFETRVLGGLSEDTIDSPGNTYRLTENGYALKAWERNPLFGHGIGASFKPTVLSDPSLSAFENNPAFGTRFIHNGWLWYAVKTGAVGLVAFAAFMLTPVVGSLSGRARGRLPLSPVEVGLAVSVVGLLVINVFEPDLHRVGTAPLAGAVLGYLAARMDSVRPHTTHSAPVRVGVSVPAEVPR
jgi:O-antigen ligase